MKTPSARIRLIFVVSASPESPLLPDYWHCAQNRVLVGGTSPVRLSIKTVGAQPITRLRDLASNLRLARRISEPSC
jgi:hypothetical protein